MTNFQPYNEYKDLQLCACIGPQGKDPMCPCAMRRAGLQSSLKPWTEDDIEALNRALKQTGE